MITATTNNGTRTHEFIQSGAILKWIPVKALKRAGNSSHITFYKQQWDFSVGADKILKDLSLWKNLPYSRSLSAKITQLGELFSKLDTTPYERKNILIQIRKLKQRRTTLRKLAMDF